MPKSEPWRYEKLTWPEINQAIEAKKVVVVPLAPPSSTGRTFRWMWTSSAHRCCPCGRSPDPR
jgi:hypothetical protein